MMFEEAPPSAGAVRALAHQLLSWANHLTTAPEIGAEMTEEERHDLVLRITMAVREACRLRAQIFPGAPFGNPVWEVMRELFIQEMNGFRTSLDNLSLSGELTAATVYDAVETLVSLGLVERTADRFNARTQWLSLSVNGRQGMFDLFSSAADFVLPGPRTIIDQPRAAIG
jgi:hypothetical protein